MKMSFEKAAAKAKELHAGQVRKFSGKSYFDEHLQPVAMMIWAYVPGLPVEVVEAGFMHDSIEDTEYTLEDLERDFNAVVAALVKEVTNVYTREAYPDMSRSERKDKEHKRLGKISDLGKLIKLCDRMHNIESLAKDDPTVWEYGHEHYYLRESKDLFKYLEDCRYTLAVSEFRRLLGKFDEVTQIYYHNRGKG